MDIILLGTTVVFFGACFGLITFFNTLSGSRD